MSLIYDGKNIEKIIYNGIVLDKVIYNGTTVFSSSSYRLMPCAKTDYNAHRVWGGIGITSIRGFNANGRFFQSGEIMTCGNKKQSFKESSVMYNYEPIPEEKLTVNWIKGGDSTIGWDRDYYIKEGKQYLNRKRCQFDWFTISSNGGSITVKNTSNIKINCRLYYTCYQEEMEDLTINPNSEITIHTIDVSYEEEIIKIWDPLGGYIPAQKIKKGSIWEIDNQIPSSGWYEPSLGSTASGEITINNRNQYGCVHHLVYSPDDPTLRNATEIWSGTLQGSSSYPGNHHTLTNQRSGYYGAFCGGGATMLSSPWVGIHLMNGSF